MARHIRVADPVAPGLAAAGLKRWRRVTGEMHTSPVGNHDLAVDTVEVWAASVSLMDISSEAWICGLSA